MSEIEPRGVDFFAFFQHPLVLGVEEVIGRRERVDLSVLEFHFQTDNFASQIGHLPAGF